MGIMLQDALLCLWRLLSNPAAIHMGCHTKARHIENCNINVSFWDLCGSLTAAYRSV